MYLSSDADTPQWMRRLSRTLTPHPTRPPRLTLFDVCAEVAEWTNDTSPSNPLVDRRSNLTSLKRDFDAAIRELGAHLRNFAAAEVTSVEEGLATLVRRDPGRVSENISELHTAATQLKSTLLRPEAIRATWFDIVDAAVEPDSPGRAEVPLTSLLLRQLRSTRRGGESVIRDVASTLVGSEAPWKQVVPVEERVEHVAASLEAPPHEHSVIVWLGYRGASSGSMGYEAGPIHFMSGWALNPESTGPDFAFLDEINKVRSTFRPPKEGKDSREVDLLARVDLGRRPIHGARRHAVQLVDAVLNIAAHWGSGWTPELRGAAVLGDDGYAVSGGEALGRSYALTDYELAQAFESVKLYGPLLAETLTPGHVPTQITSAIEAQIAADSVRNRRFGIHAPGATEMRLVIAYEDRVLQQIAAHAGCSASTLILAARRVDAIAEWVSDVDEAIRMCLSGPPVADERGLMRGEYMQRGGWLHILRFGFAHRVLLLRYLDDDEYDRRWVAEVLDTLVLRAQRRTRLDTHLDESATFEYRRARVRNAIAHGNPLNDEVARSISAYSDRLSRRVLSSAITSLSEAVCVEAAITQSAGHWASVWEGHTTEEIIERYARDAEYPTGNE